MTGHQELKGNWDWRLVGGGEKSSLIYLLDASPEFNLQVN